MARWLPAALTAAAFVGLALGACSSEPGDDTGAAGGGAGSTYGASECGVCVKEACADAIVGCQSDPECVGYLECLYACPLGADGNVALECEAACPVGSSTSALQAKAALTTCRELGDGAACAACNVPMNGPQHPVLSQDCEPATDPSMCLACSKSHCCESRWGCYDPVPSFPEACSFADCVIACLDAGSTGCEAACSTMFPIAVLEAYAAQTVCMLHHCDGETPNCSGDGREPCQECLYVTCGDAFAAFATTVDGFLLFSCIQDCPVDDTACDEVCYDTYPAAMPAYYEVANCVAALCSEDC